MQRSTVRAVVAVLLMAGLPPAVLGPQNDPIGPQPLVLAASVHWPVLAFAAGRTERRAAAPARPVPRRVAAGRPPAGPPVGADLPRAPITRAGRGRTIALTFDDGPDPRWTPTVLDLLRQYHVHATFCLVGLHVAAYPQLVRRIAREGHALCDHTWTHDEHLQRRSGATIEDEIGRTAAAIERAAGVAPRYYRAPGGNWGGPMIDIARSHDLAPLGWSVDPDDWKLPGTPAIVDRVLSAAFPGAVVLMHDGYGNRAQSVAALRSILPGLVAAGYRFVLPPRP